MKQTMMILTTAAICAAFACGSDNEPNPDGGGGLSDAGNTNNQDGGSQPDLGCGSFCMEPDAGPPPKTGRVTRCVGPSCPLGECGFSQDCSAYDGFDALDNSNLCISPAGSQEFCLKYEVDKDDGFVDIFEKAISCANSPTVVARSCFSGCGYNYAPDDCVVCNSGGCAF